MIFIVGSLINTSYKNVTLCRFKCKVPVFVSYYKQKNHSLFGDSLTFAVLFNSRARGQIHIQCVSFVWKTSHNNFFAPAAFRDIKLEADLLNLRKKSLYI